MISNDFWRVVLLVSIGGACGGVVYLSSIYLSSIDGVSRSGRNNFSISWFFLANVATGIGGAWAALLAMFWAHRAPLDVALSQTLELLSTSILAGYAGNKLLPAVAERLTSELLKKSVETAQTSAESAKTSEQTTKVLADSTLLSMLITESVAYLEKDSSRTAAKTNEFIGKLEEELSRNPRFRQAAILLARMYAEAKDQTGEAIAVMDRFIDAKRTKNPKDDDDVADALWNKANYLEQLYKASVPHNVDLRQRAIRCLQESIKIHPTYIERLQEDEDFDDLRSDPLAVGFHKPEEK